MVPMCILMLEEKMGKAQMIWKIAGSRGFKRTAGAGTFSRLNIPSGAFIYIA